MSKSTNFIYLCNIDIAISYRYRIEIETMISNQH